MKILKLMTALLALGSVSSHAGGVGGGNADSNWTIYGWQNWSYEFTDNDVRENQRISNNAANIGFSASIDTGVMVGGEAMKANFQCEQFTFHNSLNGNSDFCNRNSKISLSGSFGEIMFGQWLLPHNEMVAQWVDPFYDAGADSHTSLMGGVGYGMRFYNGGFGSFGWDDSYDPATSSEPDASNQSFNRRQNEIVQYFSPNMNGFSFRIATTNDGADESSVTDSNTNSSTVDPRIWSMGAAYETTLTNGDSVWFAVTYQKHDEWAARNYQCSDSEDDSYRIAGRYIHQWGNGSFTRVSAMWENLEYDWEDCAGGTLLTSVTSLTPDVNNLELERDSWMISGIHNFGNGFDIRASYMDADEFDCGTCATDDKTDASAFNLGLFYTMPAGTELRLTYSDINNSANSNYDFGINATSATQGNDVDMWAVGIVQWF